MKNKLLALVLILVPFMELWAQVPPPPTQGTDAAGGPGSPDGTPIDQYTLILIILAFCLSAYYLFIKNRKTVKS